MWEYISEHSWKLLMGLNYILALGAAFTVLLRNVTPARTISYIMALLLVPYAGLLFYFLFGQDYRRDKIFKRKNILNQQNVRSWQQSLVLDQEEMVAFGREVLHDKAKLIRLLHDTERSPLTFRNELELLRNGEVKFERLLNDIKKADNSVHLEYYIIRDDEIGTKVIDLLCEKAQEGVEVRLIYDYVASSFTTATRNKMEVSGVKARPFLPVYFPRFANKVNYRDHRKVVVIDGRVGYLGGINIGDEYVNTPGGDPYWRDTHLRIVGEAVGVLQLHFLLNWDFVVEEDVKIRSEWFPVPEVRATNAVQIAVSGPDTDWAHIMEAMFVAINSASSYLYLSTPYFIPTEEIIMALVAAARSGVEVKLLIPGHSDNRVAKYASYSYITPMLEAGIEVYLYQKGVIHAKTMVIDGIFSTVGTSNIDYRSFNINFEINALVYDEAFAREMERDFLADLGNSKQIVAAEWAKRPLSQKLKESFSRLWAPLL